MKNIAPIALLFLMLLAGTAISEQAIPFQEDDESTISRWTEDSQDITFRWTVFLMRKAAYNTRLSSVFIKSESDQIIPKAVTSSDLSTNAVVNDPYYNSFGSWGQNYYDMWGMRWLNASYAWDISTGSGVTVAVIDSGIDYNHSDINDNVWTNAAELNGLPGVDDDGNGYIDDVRGWDFINSDNDPMDDRGHGTHVTGVIAAEGNNGQGVIGMAYNAKIMPLKIFTSTGSSNVDIIAPAIRYAVDMGVRVINCSFSMTFYQVAIDAFQYAYDHGVIIVASVGNDGAIMSWYPALLDYVIAVGSIGVDAVRSSFSNYGSQLDFVAPGSDTLSLRAAGTDPYGGRPDFFVPANDPNAQYIRISGTSTATPFVSGLAALMISQTPGLTFADFSRRLKFSAYDLGTTGWDQYYGWGSINPSWALSYDWYDSGRIKTYWAPAPDTYNVVRYDYYDEDFSNNLGRISMRTYSSGEQSRYLEYWGSTNVVKIAERYNAEGILLIRTEYRSDGKIDRVIKDGLTAFYVYAGESIQAAINSASPGDTVYLKAGTYNEHIVLNSGVNLKGQDNYTTILNGGYAPHTNIIKTLGNNIIENLTITGGGPYLGDPSSAIRIEGNNVTVRSNIIKDNQYYGIHVWWYAGAVAIERNLFINNCIGVQLPQDQTLIQYNTFADNVISINILNGKTATVRNNIITGSSYQSIYEFCWGQNPTNGFAQVSDNTLFNNMEKGGDSSLNLPPDVENKTNGNNIANPLFTDPANGDYTVPENSPAYGRGAYAPIVGETSLKSNVGVNVLSAESASYFDMLGQLAEQNATPTYGLADNGKTDLLTAPTTSSTL
ncbi:MAG: S8 family serine peptidase [Candidatus Omnitrophica bacterium]|nr:S8 family serine peptidase [Candidatus Omnitrophota bacterium]